MKTYMWVLDRSANLIKGFYIFDFMWFALLIEDHINDNFL